MTDSPDSPGGHLLVYQSDDGRVRLEVRLQNETVWLTQSDLARLFDCSVDNIALHIRNIFEDRELDPKATTEDSSVVRQEGQRQVRRTLTYYNLDVIISVGYRVKSTVATRFRIWATQRLRELIVKGFTLDDERLKEPANDRYFEELLARLRDIRSSEKVFWRKVLDIYATSIDYDPKAPVTQDLFQRIQNQMHWATHCHTAAEVIMQRADANRPLMGITSFPGSMVLKRDTEVAKNYLNPDELNILNRIVTAYLEMAEVQALNRQPMTMQDWIERLRGFLTMTGRPVLTHAGTVTHEAALEKA
ncbi:MAG TPA: hydroxyacid dehydrogenase, partial [Planctomycetes bacterium]|nr:hydroxyacid dehydrogenase [Planctomycetota bacterium]